MATTKGTAAPAPKPPVILHFSGYNWEVRRIPSDRGGTTNPYDSENVWVDSRGFLHLRTRFTNGRWAGGEVQLTQSLGHGLYQFTVSDISQLEPAAALTLYTRDEAALDQNHREIDIEISRWGEPAGKNAQFVVPPFSEPANVYRFAAPSGPLTYSFRWQPGSLSFKTVRGSKMVAEHEFTSSVPPPGRESARINLYEYGNARVPPKGGSEVVIEKFEYLP